MTRAYNLPLPLGETNEVDPNAPYRHRLIALLSGNLDFHKYDSAYASHNFHSFPAKFPPQLPRASIDALTEEGDVVLDPMMGSGTTVIEAYITNRQALGFDIDPLSLLLSKVKIAAVDAQAVGEEGKRVLRNATRAVRQSQKELQDGLERRWNESTKRFVDYWFAPETQLELLALVREIEAVDDHGPRAFLELVLSGVIITKTGGVSMAFDLAHTRPHRAKIVYDRSGELLLGKELAEDPTPRAELLTKNLRSPLREFKKRLRQNLRAVPSMPKGSRTPGLTFADVQRLPIAGDCVDLIVTSPPYAANAIDYMRAHKFSLVWLGHTTAELRDKRAEYIGGTATTGIDYEELPKEAADVVADVATVDEKKAQVLHRYYSEMTRTLAEMLRVLRPGKAAILVVSSSNMRGKDTRADICLKSIGESVGFEVPKIGVRHLDRNRRMMPTGDDVDSSSQIQQRMHEEFVIGFLKPEARDLETAASCYSLPSE